MAEGARLESVYTFIAYRGFESLSLRQIQKSPRKRAFLYLLELDGREPEQGFDKLRLSNLKRALLARSPKGRKRRSVFD